MLTILMSCAGTTSSATASNGCYDWPVIKQIIWLFTYAIKYLYDFLGLIGIANIGLTIILFTLIVKCILLPLTIKQQKFSKITNVMQPELSVIQEKYKGRRDTFSQQAMQQETKELYAKYGVSQFGGCLQTFIQFPVLIALYGALREIPTAVTAIRDALSPIAESIANGSTALQESVTEISSSLVSTDIDTIINSLYVLPTKSWESLLDILGASAQQNYEIFLSLNSFCGWDLSQSPWNLILGGGIGILSVIVPLLAGFSQWLSFKLAQTPESAAAKGGQMAATNKSMALMMPLISVFFCFTLQVSLGIYWCIGSAFQCVLQIIINKHFRKTGIDSLIEKNRAKAEAKAKTAREKSGVKGSEISRAANINTKNIEAPQAAQSHSPTSIKDIANMNVNNPETQIKGPADNSLAAKAGAVAKYDEENPEESGKTKRKYKK